MAFISTRTGDIGDNTSGIHRADRCSKAALNTAVKSIAVDFAAQGIVTVALHPGSVMTEARKASQFTLTDSVIGLRAELDAISQARSGPFHRYDGGIIEW